VRLDAAGISSRDWETYPVIKFSEVPEIAVELVDPVSDNRHSASARPRVAQRRSDRQRRRRRLGARLRDLPLTRERVMAALLTA